MDKITKFKNLKKWLNISENNDFIELSNNINESDIERKVVAKRDIPENTIIMAIPDSKLLDNDYIDKIENIKDFQDKITSYNSLIALCMLFLFNENNENNPYWKPYFDIFPRDLNNFWYFMKPEVKNLIEHSQFNKNIEEFKYDRFTKDILVLQKAYPNLFNDPKIIDKWSKYKILVNSRVFGYTKNGKSYSGLVPLADMLNHDINNNCNWTYDDNLKSFIMTSNKFIKKGEELLDSYGSKTSFRNYILYGFIPNDVKKSNDGFITIEQETFTINSNCDNLIKKYGKNKTFEILLEYLTKIPTSRLLNYYNASNDIIYLLKLEKDIIKNLLDKYIIKK
jgi:hypothetical protein